MGGAAQPLHRGRADRAGRPHHPLHRLRSLQRDHRPGASLAVAEAASMADPRLRDQAFHLLMGSIVESGIALHYAELARALGLSVEDGRQLLHAVMEAYPIGWLHPETDYIASFPPLNNLPTQYRVTVRGQQKWFAQFGYKATSETWLFPGTTVKVEAPCLDCGDPMVLEMRDGELVTVDPPGMVGHLNYGFGPSRGRPAFL